MVCSCSKTNQLLTVFIVALTLECCVVFVQIRYKANHLGGSIDPHAAFLLYRGLKTLALRVRQQSHNALELAKYLEKQPQV